jgi:hypothetical protein
MKDHSIKPSTTHTQTERLRWVPSPRAAPMAAPCPVSAVSEHRRSQTAFLLWAPSRVTSVRFLQKE